MTLKDNISPSEIHLNNAGAKALLDNFQLSVKLVPGVLALEKAHKLGITGELFFNLGNNICDNNMNMMLYIIENTDELTLLRAVHRLDSSAKVLLALVIDKYNQQETHED